MIEFFTEPLTDHEALIWLLAYIFGLLWGMTIMYMIGYRKVKR